MHIAILTNDHAWTYNLRKELIESFLENGHKVTLVLPYGERIEYFRQIGCNFEDFPFEGQGTNITKELLLPEKYKKVLKKIKPDAVLTYTTKPNIYGAMACASLKIPYIITITGTGRTMISGISKKLMSFLYKLSSRKAFTVMFQNADNMNMFKKDKIYKGSCVLVPGSGVNTNHHALCEYPADEITRFLFIGRLNGVKRIEDFIQAAKKIKQNYKDTEFHVAGSPENDQYAQLIENAVKDNTVIYHGTLKDVRKIIKKCHCTVLPSLNEGMANVLLESASAGRVLITTNTGGCRETVDDGETGFIFEPLNVDELYCKMETFINLPFEEKRKMGLKGREKMVKEFDRKIVAEKYMEILNKTQG